MIAVTGSCWTVIQVASQAEYLDRVLSERNLPEPTVIHLDVPLDLLKKRMLARRNANVQADSQRSCGWSAGGGHLP